MQNNNVDLKKVVKFGLLSLALMALLIFASGNALAQVNTAALSGAVTDASGSAVPGATVTATSLETSAAHTATTDESGTYRLLSLPVGRYDVKVEKTGFKTAVQTGIDLVVGQQGVINMSMEVGQVNQQVTVSGEAAMVVNTTTASIAGIIDEQQVKDLPLNGRSFDNLITLNAGAVSFTALRVSGGSGTPQGNRFVVTGRRPSENYIVLNGVELTGPDQDQSLPWGVSSQLLGVDSIREYNVLQDAYGAEYGVKSGGQVSVVTQSGTNQFHGTLFEFIRNSKLDAKEFNQKLNTPIPPFKRNQFGASAGGPIIKDKTFVFGNYEGFRQRLGQVASMTVPDTCARLGETTIPGGSTCGGSIPGLAAGMLPFINAYWPVPNGAEVTELPLSSFDAAGCGTQCANTLGVAGASNNPPLSIREDYGVLRADHAITSKDSLSAVYTIDNGFEVAPILTDSLFANDVNLNYKVLSLSDTHTFSPTTLNTFTFGFSHVDMNFSPVAPSIPANLSLVKGALPGFITVGVGAGGGGAAGFISSAGSSTGSYFIDHKSLFTYADQVSKVVGKHQITFGAWFQRQRDNGAGNSVDLGRANFFESGTNSGTLSYLDLFSGKIGSAGIQSVPNETTHQWRMWIGSWFVQDQIQVKRNLTIRLGLRHEFTDGWNDPSGHANYFALAPSGILQTNPVTGTSAMAQNNSKKLFSPRIGLAWDVRGNGKTSIRASFGTYYDVQTDFTTIELASAPFNAASTVTNTNFLTITPVTPGVPPTIPFCTTALGSVGPLPPTCTAYTPRGFDSNFKVPTVEEWSLSVERQISPTMSLRVAYDGSEAFHNVVIADPNTIAPLTCTTSGGCAANLAGGLNGPNNTLNAPLIPQGTLYIPATINGSPALRPNPYLGAGTYFFRFYGTAAYNGLQVELKKQVGSGLNFKASYTYSHDLDEGSGEGLGQGADTTNVMTPYNPRFDRGPSAHDFTHLVSISGSYDLPFGHGKRWASNSSGIVNNIIGGWQANAILSMASGYPLILTTGGNTSGNGDQTGSDRVSYAPGFTSIATSGVSAGCAKGVNGLPVAPGTPLGNATTWYDPCAVVAPPAGTWGNVPVGAIRAPGWANLDMSFFKNIDFSERYKLQFRAEFFNLPNHTQLGLPNTNTSSGSAANITSSGEAFTFTQREIQFGLKLKF